MELTVHNGLLYENGKALSVVQADAAARSQGFMFAKQLVEHLEGQQPEKSRREKLKARFEPRLDLGPSHAERWTTCTASPQFLLDNADKLPSHDTKYNTEGTTAHEVAAALLEGRAPHEDDPNACPVPVKPEMRWHAFTFSEYVNELKQPGCRMWVESKLPLWYMPARNAKVDVAILNPGHSLHVVDYKYGAGIPVSPTENLQCAIYARCVGEYLHKEFNEYPANGMPVFIHIHQPRGRAAQDGAAHTWETTWGEVHQMTDLAVSLPAKAIQTDALFPQRSTEIQFRPSKKACQWCPAKGFCAARKGIITAAVPTLHNIDQTLKLPEPSTMGLEQIAAVATWGEQISKWVKDVTDYATSLAKQGTKIPGHKLVLTRGGNRTWSNPVQAKNVLLKETILRKDEVVEEVVISPTQVEKLLGKNKLPKDALALIFKSDGYPKLVPEDDKRSEWMVDPKTEFAALLEPEAETQPEE